MEDSPIPGQPVRLRSGTFASVKAKIAALLNPTVINLTSLRKKKKYENDHFIVPSGNQQFCSG